MHWFDKIEKKRNKETRESQEEIHKQPWLFFSKTFFVRKRVRSLKGRFWRTLWDVYRRLRTEHRKLCSKHGYKYQLKWRSQSRNISIASINQSKKWNEDTHESQTKITTLPLHPSFEKKNTVIEKTFFSFLLFSSRFGPLTIQDCAADLNMDMKFSFPSEIQSQYQMIWKSFTEIEFIRSDYLRWLKE